MSADPENEYFSDGMTEEIINALSKVPGIHVASRSSSFAFKGKRDVDVRQVGEKLGVTTVLEGSVRKIGNRIRIAAQLVNVDNGYQLWSETYDRQLEDVFAVQDEISRAIVDALKLKLGGEASQLVAPAKNLDAYTTYLKARFHFNKFTEQSLKKALELFQNALLQDPSFARAYAGIADVWCDLADDWVAPDDAYPRAKAAAERALQRDPGLADAMISIGKVLTLARVVIRRGRSESRARDHHCPQQFGSTMGPGHRAADNRQTRRSRRSSSKGGDAGSTSCRVCRMARAIPLVRKGLLRCACDRK